MLRLLLALVLGLIGLLLVSLLLVALMVGLLVMLLLIGLRCRLLRSSEGTREPHVEREADAEDAQAAVRACGGGVLLKGL